MTRRIILAMTVSALVLLLAAGIAYAVTKTCGQNPCKGTNNRDTLFEQVGDEVPDEIFGRRGGDTLDARDWTADEDILHGNRDSDVLYVNDGDVELDTANGDRGPNDRCIVDSEAEVGEGCEEVIIDPPSSVPL